MNSQVQNTVEAAVASAASKAPATGSVVSVASYATGTDFGVWAGIAIGLVGLLINTYYKRKSDRRAEEAHKVYMDSLRTNPPVLGDRQEGDE